MYISLPVKSFPTKWVWGLADLSCIFDDVYVMPPFFCVLMSGRTAQNFKGSLLRGPLPRYLERCLESTQAPAKQKNIIKLKRTVHSSRLRLDPDIRKRIIGL